MSTSGWLAIATTLLLVVGASAAPIWLGINDSTPPGPDLVFPEYPDDHDGTWNDTPPPDNGTFPPDNGTYPPDNGTYPPDNGTFPPDNGTWTPCDITNPPLDNWTWPLCDIIYPPVDNGTWPPDNGTNPPLDNHTYPSGPFSCSVERCTFEFSDWPQDVEVWIDGDGVRSAHITLNNLTLFSWTSPNGGWLSTQTMAYLSSWNILIIDNPDRGWINVQFSPVYQDICWIEPWMCQIDQCDFEPWLCEWDNCDYDQWGCEWDECLIEPWLCGPEPWPPWDNDTYPPIDPPMEECEVPGVDCPQPIFTRPPVEPVVCELDWTTLQTDADMACNMVWDWPMCGTDPQLWAWEEYKDTNSDGTLEDWLIPLYPAWQEWQVDHPDGDIGWYVAELWELEHPNESW